MTRAGRLNRLEEALDTAEARDTALGHVLASITAALARIEDKLDPVTPGGIAGIATDVKAARQSAEAAFAACQAITPEAISRAVKPSASRPGSRAAPRTPPGG